MSEHARVLFFATLRDRAGLKETEIEFSPGAKIADIKAAIYEKFPALEFYKETLIVAVNHEFAADDDIVADGAEIAMFPPVSGGEIIQATNPTVAEITDREIDVNSLVTRITLQTTGGVCVFTGTVRGITSRGLPHETEQLEYEAYRDMAEVKIRQICLEIRSRWAEIEGIAIVQRVGTLKPGEISVVVACGAAHRDLGIFDAAHYGIDRLKEIVPVWKKEIAPDGEEWVEGDYLPHKGE